MSQSQPIPIPSEIIEPRPCTQCGALMVLAYVKPKAIAVDQYTFECIKCGYSAKTLIQISRRWHPLVGPQGVLQGEAKSHEAGRKRS